MLNLNNMHLQYDCDQKTHIPLIFLLTQYIPDTQKNSKQRKYNKIRTNILKFRKFITNFQKTVKIRKIRKFKTAGRPDFCKNSILDVSRGSNYASGISVFGSLFCFFTCSFLMCFLDYFYTSNLCITSKV